MNINIFHTHMHLILGRKVGGWREEFTEKNIRKFKDLSGDILIKLNYEKDNNW